MLHGLVLCGHCPWPPLCHLNGGVPMYPARNLEGILTLRPFTPCTSSVTSPADSAPPNISHISCHLSTPVQAPLALTSLQPLSCFRPLPLQSTLHPHCSNNDYCLLRIENVPGTVLGTLYQYHFDPHNFPVLEGDHFFINEETEFRG